jgi:serine O-acetyltransferase
LEINNLASAALPNRRAVVQAFNHLRHALYLGFYSTRALSRTNLRHTVAEHLYPAFEILVEQISRVLLYQKNTGNGRVPRERDWAEHVVLRLFQAIPALRDKLNRDVLAAYEGDPAAQNVEEVVFSYPALAAITAHRVAHILHTEQVPLIPRILSETAHGETGIDIHPGASIGERFFIDHGTGVVIGETTVIGSNVKIYQGVTLGALSLPRGAGGELLRGRKRHPTIEDDVTIYSGTTILGGDTVIGRGSVIGGNVWLVHSVPPNSKVTFQPGSSGTVSPPPPAPPAPRRRRSRGARVPRRRAASDRN